MTFENIPLVIVDPVTGKYYCSILPYGSNYINFFYSESYDDFVKTVTDKPIMQSQWEELYSDQPPLFIKAESGWFYMGDIVLHPIFKQALVVNGNLAFYYWNWQSYDATNNEIRSGDIVSYDENGNRIAVYDLGSWLLNSHMDENKCYIQNKTTGEIFDVSALFDEDYPYPNFYATGHINFNAGTCFDTKTNTFYLFKDWQDIYPDRTLPLNDSLYIVKAYDTYVYIGYLDESSNTIKLAYMISEDDYSTYIAVFESYAVVYKISDDNQIHMTKITSYIDCENLLTPSDAETLCTVEKQVLTPVENVTIISDLQPQSWSYEPTFVILNQAYFESLCKCQCLSTNLAYYVDNEVFAKVQSFFNGFSVDSVKISDSSSDFDIVDEVTFDNQYSMYSDSFPLFVGQNETGNITFYNTTKTDPISIDYETGPILLSQGGSLSYKVSYPDIETFNTSVKLTIAYELESQNITATIASDFGTIGSNVITLVNQNNNLTYPVTVTLEPYEIDDFTFTATIQPSPSLYNPYWTTCFVTSDPDPNDPSKTILTFKGQPNDVVQVSEVSIGLPEKILSINVDGVNQLPAEVDPDPNTKSVTTTTPFTFRGSSTLEINTTLHTIVKDNTPVVDDVLSVWYASQYDCPCEIKLHITTSTAIWLSVTTEANVEPGGYYVTNLGSSVRTGCFYDIQSPEVDSGSMFPYNMTFLSSFDPVFLCYDPNDSSSLYYQALVDAFQSSNSITVSPRKLVISDLNKIFPIQNAQYFFVLLNDGTLFRCAPNSSYKRYINPITFQNVEFVKSLSNTIYIVYDSGADKTYIFDGWTYIELDGQHFDGSYTITSDGLYVWVYNGSYYEYSYNDHQLKVYKINSDNPSHVFRLGNDSYPWMISDLANKQIQLVSQDLTSYVTLSIDTQEDLSQHTLKFANTNMFIVGDSKLWLGFKYKENLTQEFCYGTINSVSYSASTSSSSPLLSLELVATYDGTSYNESVSTELTEYSTSYEWVITKRPLKALDQ